MLFIICIHFISSLFFLFFSNGLLGIAYVNTKTAVFAIVLAWYSRGLLLSACTLLLRYFFAIIRILLLKVGGT
jgi:hypothetical protein